MQNGTRFRSRSTWFFFSIRRPQIVRSRIYPSPAGPTESLLSLDAWSQLAETNQVLAELEPDVEALLVNRTNGAREYYRVSIDRCYALVGLIRTRWRGLSGGTEVWDAACTIISLRCATRRAAPSGDLVHG